MSFNTKHQFLIVIFLLGCHACLSQNYGDTTITSYYPDSTVKSIAGYSDDTLQGQSKFYHENGTLSAIMNFVKGKKDGLCFHYSTDGELKRIYVYDSGDMVLETKLGEDCEIIMQSVHLDDGRMELFHYSEGKLDNCLFK